MTVKHLTREEILGANDARTVDVRVREWGGVVRLRSLTARERGEYERWLDGEDGAESKEAVLMTLRERLVFLTAINEDGSRKFTEPGDVTVLGQKNGAILNRLFASAMKLNKIRDADVEEMVKNSVSGPTSDSPSTSAEPSAE